MLSVFYFPRGSYHHLKSFPVCLSYGECKFPERIVVACSGPGMEPGSEQMFNTYLLKQSINQVELVTKLVNN